MPSAIPSFKTCQSCQFSKNLQRFRWCNQCHVPFTDIPPIAGGQQLLTRQGPPFGKGPGPPKILPTTYAVAKTDAYAVIVTPPSSLMPQTTSPPSMSPPPGEPPPLAPPVTSMPAALRVTPPPPPTTPMQLPLGFGRLAEPTDDVGLIPPKKAPIVFPPPPLPSAPPQVHPSSVPRHVAPPLRMPPAHPSSADTLTSQSRIEQPAWKHGILNLPVVDLYRPNTWPNWFGKIMMVPKSAEATFLSSLDTPPPWLIKLIRGCAFLPAHVTSVFKGSASELNTSFCGEGIEREKVYDIVRDFFVCHFPSLPSDEEIESLSSPQLSELINKQKTFVVHLADLARMMHDLQERAEHCSEGCESQFQMNDEVITKAREVLAARHPENSGSNPPLSASPGPLPPKFAHILTKISGCLAAVAKNPKFCQGDDADNMIKSVKFLDQLTCANTPLGESAASVPDAADAIMALPAELRLLEDEEDMDSHANKRVRLASDTEIAASDPYGSLPGPSDPSPSPLAVPPPGPDSVVRTAPLPLLPASDPPTDPRRRVTGKSPPGKCNQWGTMCQIFDMSPRAAVSHSAFECSVAEVAFIDPAFESAVGSSNADAGGVSLPPGDSIMSETLSSVGSMDEDLAVPSAEGVRAVPNVKAAASLKPSSKVAPRPSSKNPAINLSPQQKRNLAKKLRKQARQAAAA